MTVARDWKLDLVICSRLSRGFCLSIQRPPPLTLEDGEAKVVFYRRLLRQLATKLCVKRLCAIHVRDGNYSNFELHINLHMKLLFFVISTHEAMRLVGLLEPSTQALEEVLAKISILFAAQEPVHHLQARRSAQRPYVKSC